MEKQKELLKPRLDAAENFSQVSNYHLTRCVHWKELEVVNYDLINQYNMKIKTTIDNLHFYKVEIIIIMNWKYDEIAIEVIKGFFHLWYNINRTYAWC